MTILLWLGACSSTSSVPCTVDSECRRYAALCVDNGCRVPDGVDLSGVDFAEPVDQSMPADLAIAIDQGLACVSSADCPAGLPICGADHVCRTCTTGDNAACVEHDVKTPSCNVTSGSCVACQKATEAVDCPSPATSVCSTDGSCRRACAVDTDCVGGICDPVALNATTPTCARANEIVRVKGATGCTGAHAGTTTDPMCSLDDAITYLPKGGFIEVLVGTPLSPPTKPIDKPYAVVGDGKISGPNVGAMNLSQTGFTVKSGGSLYLRNIDIADTKNAAVRCTGGKLTVLQSEIQNTKPTAIVASNCDVLIDRSRISGSENGIDHDGGHLTVTNTFIQDNTGVALKTSANTTTDRAAYLTIVDNMPTNTSLGGALSCGGAVSIFNSIIVANRQNAGGTSHTGSCMFSYSDVIPTVAGAAMHNVMPDFPAPVITPRSYALQGATQNNLSCCLSQAQPLGGNWYDFAGTFRSAQTPDIGAYEAP